MAATIAELFELPEETSGGRVIKLVYSESKNTLSVLAEFDRTLSAKALSDVSESAFADIVLSNSANTLSVFLLSL